MDLRVRRYTADDTDALATFIAAHEWPYHGGSRRSIDDARAAITGWWQNASDIHLLTDPSGDIVGCLHLYEMDEPTPVFDLRIGAEHRGHGLGTQTLRWLAEHVFTTTALHRIEGHTRVDNLAMQAAFRKAGGWVCEAYYRQGWRGEGGTWHDALTFTILKDDWRAGSVTPVILPA